MKKIIMLITMFVLSVGFLMAQSTFTYQAVVVDADGNLVVDENVTANVTITDGNGTNYVQTINGIHTSLNGLAVFSINAPELDDWSSATINVQFNTSSVTIPNYGPEQVAGVPYALQSPDDMLTTDIIADYYGRATTTMDDMYAILEALENNENNLAEDWKEAFIDTVINNRPVAKEILLHYLHTGTPDDVQALYDAFDGNDDLKAALIEVIKELIQDNRELVYDILRQYAINLTTTEVNNIFDALSDEVKERIVIRAANYVKEEGHQSTLIIPVLMDYMENITTDEFDELVATLENNGPVFQVMLDQFNEWMDEYFQTHYTGGTHVEDVVADAIEDTYYAQCNPPIDLCQLQSDLVELNTCFALTNTLVVTKNPDNGDYEASVLNYMGTKNPTSVTYSISGMSILSGGTFSGTDHGDVIISTTDKYIILSDINSLIPELMPDESFTITVTITVPDCTVDPVTYKYTAQ